MVMVVDMTFWWWLQRGGGDGGDVMVMVGMEWWWLAIFKERKKKKCLIDGGGCAWMVVKEIEDVLLEEMEKFGWWFKQDIDGENEDDNENKLVMVSEEGSMN
ncbi:hypothetical protein Tco_0273552 [Tanacetum coccineum]